MGLVTPLSPPAAGYIFERFIFHRVLKYLAKVDDLSKHEYFVPFLEHGGKLPEWIKGAKINIKLPINQDRNGPIDLFAKDKLSFDDYCRNTDTASAYIPDNRARCDAEFSLLTRDSKHILGLVQWKFAVHLSKARLDDAIRTTSIASAYMTKNGRKTNATNKRKVTLSAVEERFQPSERGSLHILFTFPFHANDEDLPQVVDGQDVYMVLDRIRSREVLEDQEWGYLDALKCDLSAITEQMENQSRRGLCP
jgi:hypothetical protein